VWAIAIITILANLGVSLVPLLASAGVATAALGFGAQSIVRDFLAGFFMLAEGQFEIGDSIDVGQASGTVEAITLRRTQLRGADGTVWHVPNGVINRVGNHSKQWRQAVLDLRVAPDADLTRAREVMEAAARSLVATPAWSASVLSQPQECGVEDLGGDGALLRLVVTTMPGRQADLLRDLRVAVKQAFDDNGIELAGPRVAGGAT
jgi:small conductance mechanosensitive channel